MTDRERLTELLNNFVYDIILCDTCEILDRDCAACENERLADYLLEHGVIVLPCKVGDTVYIKGKPVKISFLHIENEITYCVQLDCGELDCFSCPFYEDVTSWEGEHDCGTYGYIEFTENDFGKTVFLTREEAERKLKEREQK